MWFVSQFKAHPAWQAHVLRGAGQALSTSLSDGQTITTLQGEDITVTIGMNGVMINNATVVVADIVADNGVVHVIDAVLLPPAPTPTTVVDVIVVFDFLVVVDLLD